MKNSTLFTVLVFAIIYFLSLIGLIFIASEDTVLRNWILPTAFFGSGIIIGVVILWDEYKRYRGLDW